MGFSWCYFINQKLCQFEPTLTPESWPFFSFQPFFIPGVQEYLNKILTTVTGPNKPKTSGKPLRIADLQPPASGQDNPDTLYTKDMNSIPSSHQCRMFKDIEDRNIVTDCGLPHHLLVPRWLQYGLTPSNILYILSIDPKVLKRVEKALFWWQ